MTNDDRSTWIAFIIVFLVLPMFATCYGNCEKQKLERAWHQEEQLAKDHCASEHRRTRDYLQCMEEWYYWKNKMQEDTDRYYENYQSDSLP